MKGAFDFENVVFVEPVDLDDGPRRIGPIASQLLLYLVADRAIAVHVGCVYDDA
jgi:hypothetical protein